MRGGEERKQIDRIKFNNVRWACNGIFKMDAPAEAAPQVHYLPSYSSLSLSLKIVNM